MITLKSTFRIYRHSFIPWWRCKPKPGIFLFNATLFKDLQLMLQRGLRAFFLSIKSRVERDCLPVSQNKTENLNNTYSKNACLQAPKSADYRYMMRVLKETGIDRGGRPENKGRPINVMIELSKMTLFQKSLNNYLALIPVQR